MQSFYILSILKFIYLFMLVLIYSYLSDEHFLHFNVVVQEDHPYYKTSRGVSQTITVDLIITRSVFYAFDQLLISNVT